MIILDCVQGSPEWDAARLGIPSSSRFSDILTPKGKLSASRRKYLCELLAEHALGTRQDEFQGNYWTERGLDLEAEAGARYAFQTGLTVRRVGFIYRDETRLVGCSPDWLVVDGDDIAGIAEFKCPAPKTHVGYLLGEGIGGAYWQQMQGQLWVTGLPWVDGVSYCPGLPPSIVRTLPDPEFQAALDEAIPAFVREMLVGRERINQLMGAK